MGTVISLAGNPYPAILNPMPSKSKFLPNVLLSAARQEAQSQKKADEDQ